MYMTAIIFCTLFYLMLLIMYLSGKRMRNEAKLISVPGISAIMAFTLNEGLRFGRGIDYNAYWIDYDDYANSAISYQDVGFTYLEKILINFGLPWQSCVLLMSLVSIVSVLFFLKMYKEIFPYVLPIFILFFAFSAENLMRWNLAFSFVLIGLSFQIESGTQLSCKYLFFSAIGCLFHYAMIPVPIILYLALFIKKPIMNPFIAAALVILLLILFNSSIVVGVVNFINSFDVISGRYLNYVDDAQYWASRSVGGRSKFAWLTDYDTLIGVFLLFAFNVFKVKIRKYIYAYNLFLIGLIFLPIAKQVELLNRYDLLFFYFRAIVFAYILSKVVRNGVKNYRFLYPISLIVFIMAVTQPIRMAYNSNPQTLLYIWDSEGKSPEYMLHVYYSSHRK